MKNTAKAKLNGIVKQFVMTRNYKIAYLFVSILKTNLSANTLSSIKNDHLPNGLRFTRAASRREAKRSVSAGFTLVGAPTFPPDETDFRRASNYDILHPSGTQTVHAHWCPGPLPDPSWILVSGHDDFVSGGASGDPD